MALTTLTHLLGGAEYTGGITSQTHLLGGKVSSGGLTNLTFGGFHPSGLSFCGGLQE